MTCKYNIGALKNVIGLTSSPYFVAGVNTVNSITLSDTLYATDIEVDEEQTLDERWQFRRTLAFTLPGYHDETLLSNVSGLFIETSDGVAYCFNPLSTFDVAYTYTFSENEDSTRYTATTVSNMPMIKAAVTMDVPTVCEYLKDRPNKIAYNERIYSSIHDNEVVYTNSGFTVIEDAKNISLTESYDNGRRTHSVSFYLPDNQLGNDALEFSNDYSFVVTTTAGHQIAVGFWGLGLEASYAYEDDAVHLTFTGTYEGRGLIITDSLSPITDTHWVYTASEGYYECAGDGIATYILQKEVDALGNASGNYKVLDGHEAEIGPEINVVGTFTETTSFLSSQCVETPCYVSTSMPDTLILQPGESKNFTIKTRDNWSLTRTVVTVMPTTGLGGTTTNIVVSAPAADTEQSGYIDITSCNVTKRINVVVNSTAIECFPQGSTYSINAAAQTIRIASRCPLSAASIEFVEDGSARVNGKYVEATVTANQINGTRTIPVSVTMADGRQLTLTIVQDRRIVEWYNDSTVCEDGNLYNLERMYTGVTEGRLSPTYTTRRGSLIESGSTECQGEVYRYIQQAYTYCVDSTPYYVVKEQVSHDGASTWEETGYESLGEVAEGEVCPEETWIYYWELSDVEGCADPLTIVPKLKLFLTDGSVVDVEYDGNPTLTTGDTVGHVSDILTVSAATIGDNVNIIDGLAFNNFYNIKNINVAPSVDTLSNSSFLNTFSLKSIELPNSIVEIPANCFEDAGLSAVTLPASIRTIGKQAFVDNNHLRTVDILPNCTSIGALSFSASSGSCSAITVYSFAINPPEPTGSGQGALAQNFLSGRAFSGITIYCPKGSLSDYMSSWNQYTSTTIQARNRIFESDWLAVIDTTANTRVTVGATGETTLNASNIETYRETAKKVIIPQNVTAVTDNVLSGFPGLEEVILFNTIYNLGNNFGRDCPKLRRVTIMRDSIFPVTGSGLFQGCRNIEEVWLPSNADVALWLRFLPDIQENQIYYFQ